MSAPNYTIIIAEKIVTYRKENHISQSAFGRLIGVSAQAVCKWETGVCCPDIILLPYLAKILACSTDDFFRITET